MHKCIKCEEKHKGKFCPNCGQLKLHRIEWKHLLSQILGVLEMNQGLTYNLKELTLRPNKFINKYLSGHTKGVMNPFSYIVVILTSLTFALGIIENLGDGFKGLKLLDVTVNWKFFLFLVIPLFLCVVIFRWIHGKRLIEAITESTFFTSHYVLLMCFFVIVLNLIKLTWAVQTEVFSSGATLFSDDKFTYLIFALANLTAYAYAFFKPKIHMPRGNFRQIAKDISRIGALILIFFLNFIILDMGIWISSSGAGVFSASDSEESKKTYKNWSLLKMRSEKQTDLNNYLLQFDSLNQDVHDQVSVISQRLDSLENYIFKDTLDYQHIDQMSDWMRVKVDYSHVLDESINSHLLKLRQKTKVFNELLFKNDSTALKYEINLSQLKAKSNAEVLNYIEDKKQELLTIESLLILKSIDGN